jgi:hypothetical protein
VKLFSVKRITPLLRQATLIGDASACKSRFQEHHVLRIAQNASEHFEKWKEPH